MPVIDYYKKMDKVRDVNSDQTPEEVYAQTKGHFGRFA
jgi:UMP-CMP kinase